MENSLENILKEANFSEIASRLYLRLLEAGPTPARRLAENLNIPRPSVYDHLRVLIEQGLVTEREENNIKVFAADEPKRLLQLMQEKTDRLQQQTEGLRKILPELTKKHSPLEPKIKFYLGREGIRNVLRDMLWYENIETLAMWPIKDMLEIVDRDYLAELNRKRIRRGISIRGIWPQDQLVNLKDYQFLGVGPKHLRTMHLAPTGITWPMSYWLYADKVAFISSQREGFSFLVASADFAELQRLQFEFIWQATKPYKPASYKDTFIKTI